MTTTYSCKKDLIGKHLVEDDIVIFTLKSISVTYKVCSNHLQRHHSGGNEKIFSLLNIEKPATFCEECTKLKILSGDWPEISLREGYSSIQISVALTDIVNKLYDYVELKHPSMSLDSKEITISNFRDNKIEIGKDIIFHFPDGKNLKCRIGDHYFDFTGSKGGHPGGVDMLLSKLEIIKKDIHNSFMGKRVFTPAESWPCYENTTQIRNSVIFLFEKLQKIWDFYSLYSIGSLSLSATASGTITVDASTTQHSKTQTNEYKTKGSTVKVPRQVASIRTGQRPTGQRIQGRTSKTRIGVGHLSYQKIIG